MIPESPPISTLPGFSLRRFAYLRVLLVWSADECPGQTHEIMIILMRFDLERNESLSTIVSLDALKGTCTPGTPLFFASRAQTHSLRARSDLLI